MSWVILQPPTLWQDGYHGIDTLVSVNKEKDHAVVKVMCDNTDIPDDFSSSLVLYTNSKYRK